MKTSEKPFGTSNTTSKTSKNKTGLSKEISVLDAITTPSELLRETFINYILYYVLISYIVNRKKYDTILGKFIVLPGSAAGGAFAGYKLAQIITEMV